MRTATITNDEQLRETQAHEIILKTSNLLWSTLRRAEVEHFGWRSSTIFLPERLMSIHKSFHFLPIQAAGVTEAVSDALEKADDKRQMFWDAFSKLKKWCKVSQETSCVASGKVSLGYWAQRRQENNSIKNAPKSRLRTSAALTAYQAITRGRLQAREWREY